MTKTWKFLLRCSQLVVLGTGVGLAVNLVRGTTQARNVWVFAMALAIAGFVWWGMRTVSSDRPS